MQEQYTSVPSGASIGNSQKPWPVAVSQNPSSLLLEGGRPAGVYPPAGLPLLEGGDASLGIRANTTFTLGFPPEFEEWKRNGERQINRSTLLELQRESAKLFRGVGDEVLASWGVAPGTVGSTKAYHRVTRCLWSVWSPDGVQVVHSPEHGRATYKGLVTCGSWSACPVCGSKIAEARRRDIQSAVDVMRSRGYVTALGTLTLPHKAGDDLGQLVGRLNGSYEKLRSNRRYDWGSLSSRYGIEAAGRGGVVKDRLFIIRAFECTHGYNGWHPHLHILLFLRPGADVAQFEGELRDIWYMALGGQFAPDDNGELRPVELDRWRRGCTVTSNDGDVAGYVSKFGRPKRWDVSHELAMGQRKVGRGGHSPHYTPLGLLHLYNSTGSRDAARLWIEFGAVMFGRAMLTWSPGLREFVGLGAEISDEEVAEDTHDYLVSLASVARPLWENIRSSGLRSELLDVADAGDALAVLEWLRARDGCLWPPGVCQSLPGATIGGG